MFAKHCDMFTERYDMFTKHCDMFTKRYDMFTKHFEYDFFISYDKGSKLI